MASADLAGEHEAADVARGDDLAVDLEQRVHDRGEALVGGEQPRVALRLVAEAEVLADETRVAPSAPTSTSSMNSRGRALAKSASKGITISSSHAQRGDQLGLARERRQQLRRVLRARRPRRDADRR